MKTYSILALAIMALWIGSADAKYSGGTGEPNDPYRIATPQDLNNIGNYKEDWNKHFILINDVNLAQYTGTQFKIIGNRTTKFTGVFDGNEHKVWSFTWSSTGRDYIGLFGYVSLAGQIKNLGMENVDVNAVDGGPVGGMVGENRGAITNCYSTGNVRGEDCVGGLVGVNDNGTITNCYSISDIAGKGFVGGLTGSSNWTVTDCYSMGMVSGTGDMIGGLVGGNYGPITNCYSSSSVSGMSVVGGLVGFNDPAAPEISSCYSTGSVSGGDCVGGLVGFNMLCPIINCYSTGNVSGQSNFGGLVGFNAMGTVAKSFWDIETSDCNTSSGGTPKTTAEMKTKSTFIDAGWDFVNIWDICEGTSYPRLRWQIPGGDFLCPYGVDFADFAILASAWRSNPNDPRWNPACDISKPKDSVIDELDLAVLCENWLDGTTP